MDYKLNIEVTASEADKILAGLAASKENLDQLSQRIVRDAQIQIAEINAEIQAQQEKAEEEAKKENEKKGKKE